MADPVDPRIAGYRFADPALLRTALTHPSAASGAEGSGSYERLEFLGDAVLGLLVAHRLFGENPEVAEGTLSAERARLVRGSYLVGRARAIGLEERIDTGPKGPSRPLPDSVLEDALEGVLGAIYLDGGLAAARAAFDHLFPAEAFHLSAEAAVRANPKGALQEWAQGLQPPTLPAYEILATEGPPHDRTFTARVTVADRVEATGEGRSKQDAEAAAAAKAFAEVGPD